MAYFRLKNESNIDLYLIRWRDTAHTDSEITTVKTNAQNFDSGNYGFSIGYKGTLPEGTVINFDTKAYNESATFYPCSESTLTHKGYTIFGWDSADGNFVTTLKPSSYNYSIVKSVSEPKYTKLTVNTTNCTVTFGDGLGGVYTADNIPIGKTVEATFVPKSGYAWGTEPPTITDGTNVIATGKIPTNKTGQIRISFTVPENIVANGTCGINYSNVTLNLTNCSIDDVTIGTVVGLTINKIPVGETATVTIVPDKRSTWKENPTFTSDGTVIATGSYKSATQKATIEVTAKQNMTLNATCEAVTIPVGVSVTYGNATYTPDVVHYGDVLKATFTANDGYYFVDKPYIEYTYTLGIKQKYADISEDGLTATAELDIDSIGYDVTQIMLEGVATLKPSIPTVSNSLIKAYKITQSGLDELATKRWNVQTGSGEQVVDLAYYITTLKKFYCNIPESLKTTLVLYTYDTKIECGVVSGDVVTIDCGEITIESTNGNNNDYENTNVEIMLPFIGFSPLDSAVVGKTLHLYYDISTITGDCVARIVIDDITRYEFSGNASEDIPYILNNVQWQLKGSVSFNSSSLYGLKPYVIITYHENYNENEQLVIDDNRRATLNTLTGLNYINDIVIDDMSIPDDVKELIYTKLSNGVIF